MKNSRVELNEEIAKEIDDQERREKSIKVLKITALIFIPLFIFFSLSYISLRFIGNIGIIVKEYPIYNETIPKDFHGIKIIQFSDIHYNQESSKEKLNDLVNIINKINPDIVIFTGDLIDSNHNITLQEKIELITKLEKINATIGKYAIYGEDDGSIAYDILTNSDFEILTNTIKNIHINKSSIQLIALDDNKNNYEKLLSEKNNTYSIAITHKPDNSKDIVDIFNSPLILAGHSHNGQVRLPFIGPMMKKEGSKKYIDSYYKINNTELLISSGIGNSKYNFRLFNHPSINFIRLKSLTQ